LAGRAGFATALAAARAGDFLTAFWATGLGLERALRMIFAMMRVY